MFVEIPQNLYNKLKNILDKLGLQYEVSDCTLPGELLKILHIEFNKDLSENDILKINKIIDDYYEQEYKNIKESTLPIIEVDNTEEIFIERSTKNYEDAEKA